MTHFKFLDAYRGLMCLMVVVTHSSHSIRYDQKSREFISVFVRLVGKCGLAGFFLLSSFLLTYRLCDELEKTPLRSKQTALIISKYFIRRFMRIYVVYFVYCTLFTVLPFLLPRNFLQIVKKNRFF